MKWALFSKSIFYGGFMMRTHKGLLVLLAVFLMLTTNAQMALVPLPLDDDTAFGTVPKASGFLSPDEYRDASIHVLVERFQHQGMDCMQVNITIQDPSQIRTTKSSRSFTDKEMVVATQMAKKARAVFAVNGDFFKYQVQGFTIRQQHVVKKRLIRAASEKYDILFIDDLGDFSFTKNATTESAQEFMDALEAGGRKVVNSFTFGPVLIENGVIQPFDPTLWHGDMPMQRVAIAQVGPLQYAVFQSGGATQLKTGLTTTEFATMILERAPGVKLVYNLDGGGSSNLVFNNEKINTNWDVREICDMIYFASIDDGDGQ